MQKLIRKFQLILLIVLGSTLYGNAQDNNKELNNYFSVGTSNRFFRTFNFTYARSLDEKNFLRLNSGFQLKSKYDSYESNVYAMFIQVNNRKRVENYSYVSLGYGRFILPKFGLYFAVDLIYQYNYFEDVFYQDNRGATSASTSNISTLYQNSGGIVGSVGVNLKFLKREHYNLFANFELNSAILCSNERVIIYAEEYGGYSGANLVYFDNPKVSEDNIFTSRAIFQLNLGVNF